MAVVRHGVDFAAFHFLHGHSKQAVVQQQHVAGADIVRQLAVIQPHTFARAFAFQCGVKQQGFAGMDLDAAADQLGNADFRALQIGHNRHFAPCLPRGFAHDFGIVFMKFGRAVAEIEAHHVQCADGNHVAQQSHIVAAGAECGHDFGVVADAVQIALCCCHVAVLAVVKVWIMLQIIANLGAAGDGRRGAGCFFGLLAKARGRRRNVMRTVIVD